MIKFLLTACLAILLLPQTAIAKPTLKSKVKFEKCVDKKERKSWQKSFFSNVPELKKELRTIEQEESYEEEFIEKDFNESSDTDVLEKETAIQKRAIKRAERRVHKQVPKKTKIKKVKPQILEDDLCPDIDTVLEEEELSPDIDTAFEIEDVDFIKENEESQELPDEIVVDKHNNRDSCGETTDDDSYEPNDENGEPEIKSQKNRAPINIFKHLNRSRKSKGVRNKKRYF